MSNPSHEEQARMQTAIAKVKQLAGGLPGHRATGGNLILYGPPGTGKDHLTIALLRFAILQFGMCVRWCNGQADLAQVNVDGNRKWGRNNESPPSTFERRLDTAQGGVDQPLDTTAE